MENEVPQIEPGLLYTPQTLPDDCRYIFTEQDFLQYGLPTFFVTTRSQSVTPIMARIYLTDYFLLPWEDRFVPRHTLHDEVRKHHPDCSPSALPAPNVQQLLLAEVFEDDSFEAPPHMAMRGYVFLFWSQLFPGLPDHYLAPLQAWIDENDIYALIDRQVTDQRNRDRLLKGQDQVAIPEAESEDTENSDDIVF